MASKSGRPSEDADMECVICYDRLEERTLLPCSCNVAYCERCWNCALARSFQAGGRARCPTCRTPVRVDFDAARCRLEFSSELEAADVQRDAYGRNQQQLRFRAETVRRLARQAVPAQVRLLERHRDMYSELEELAGRCDVELGKLSVSQLQHLIEESSGFRVNCSDKDLLVQQLRLHAGGTDILVSTCASQCCPNPMCVCGASLRRVAGRQRRGMSERNCTRVRCDICEKFLPLNVGMWTCENGSSTILHASAYDVCDSCFAHHACGLALFASASEPCGESDIWV